jgi:hypothetical protein
MPGISKCNAPNRLTVAQWPNVETATIREWATDAIRYWEPRRILYNLVLAAIVLTYFAMGLPATKGLLTVNFVLLLFLLAVLANVAYCAAYAVDIFAQISGFRELWQRVRWVLFAIGVAFAGVITRFWSLALFNPGH